jgi:hypothetical protein
MLARPSLARVLPGTGDSFDLDGFRDWTAALAAPPL